MIAPHREPVAECDGDRKVPEERHERQHARGKRDARDSGEHAFRRRPAQQPEQREHGEDRARRYHYEDQRGLRETHCARPPTGD
jgi:hypothetical protein